ncbi:MAG: N-acetyltransferase [Acidobacteriaceae bacterium]|nr:N-acetyltransferase [Acidobacteriaceae bacterium]MBV9612488.1 N-acetyltransferase [Acidobacteriaceae bacterium]
MTRIAVNLRKASMHDIPRVLALINAYAAQGIMLPRTEFELSENIRDFSVAYDDDLLVGCGALHFYTPVAAEVRSLAVLPAVAQHGVGRAVVEALEGEARENDLESIFAFTYVPGFFRKLGFSEVERGELPLKVWKDCLRCPKFQNCDEIAVVKRLRPTRGEGELYRLQTDAPGELIQLPQIVTPNRDK